MEEKLHSMRYQLVKKLRREPSAEELAEVMSVSLQDVEDMLREARPLDITAILETTGRGNKS